MKELKEQDYGITFNNDILHRFEAYIDVKDKSRQSYESGLKNFLLWLQMNEIRYPERADVIRWRDELLQDHRANTVKLYLAAVKLFFKWLSSEQLYPDVSDRIKSPTIPDGHKRDYLTVPQLRDMLAIMPRETEKDKRNYAIVALMVTTGIRTVEVARANVEDLTTIACRQVLYIAGKGRDDKYDYVIVPPELDAIIRDYLRSRRPGAKPLFVSTSRNNAGDRLSQRTISGIAKDALRAAGYDSARLTAHSLRHSHAMAALDAGAGMKELTQNLRHKTGATTEVYIHDRDMIENTCCERVAAAVLGL